MGGGLAFTASPPGFTLPLRFPFLGGGGQPRGLGSACRAVRISLFQTNTGIRKNLEQEIIHYSFKTSFFDIFVSDLRVLGAGRDMTLAGLSSFGDAHCRLIRETWLPSSGNLQSTKSFLNEGSASESPHGRGKTRPCARRSHPNCLQRNIDSAIFS